MLLEFLFVFFTLRIPLVHDIYAVAQKFLNKFYDILFAFMFLVERCETKFVEAFTSNCSPLWQRSVKIKWLRLSTCFLRCYFIRTWSNFISSMHALGSYYKTNLSWSRIRAKFCQLIISLYLWFCSNLNWRNSNLRSLSLIFSAKKIWLQINLQVTGKVSLEFDFSLGLLL